MKVPETATGVIHVGGGLGQEARRYAHRRLPVLWIEPLKENVEVIAAKCCRWPEQRVARALVSDRDGERVSFHVTHGTNNRTTSSSMLPLAEHRNRFPHVTEWQTIQLETVTLPTLLERYKPTGNHLVIDVQGAELKVLAGAEPVLPRFRSVAVEVSTVELYAGQPLADDITAWLAGRGFWFRDWDRGRHAWHTDYLFCRKESSSGLGSWNHDGTAPGANAVEDRGVA